MNPFDLTGPQFLLFYLIFAGLVLTGMVYWRRRAESESPRIDLSDPYLIAYLRGGEKEVLRVAAIALIDRGLLVRKGRELQGAEKVSPDSVREPIEKLLLKKYERAGQASWIFHDDRLRNECIAYGRTLMATRLLPDKSIKQARLIRLLIACFLLGGVALTKVLIALSAGRTNVGFLIVLAIIAIVVAVAISFPRLTASGEAMIEDAQSLYRGMRDRAASLRSRGAGTSAGSADIEPLMVAAVFGAGVLVPGSTFSSTDSSFEESKKRESSSSCSAGVSSCGSISSCSSSGSSCSSASGSSCGSGGSSCGGGGGCGGCGGS